MYLLPTGSSAGHNKVKVQVISSYSLEASTTSFPNPIKDPRHFKVFGKAFKFHGSSFGRREHGHIEETTQFLNRPTNADLLRWLRTS